MLDLENCQAEEQRGQELASSLTDCTTGETHGKQKQPGGNKRACLHGRAASQLQDGMKKVLPIRDRYVQVHESKAWHSGRRVPRKLWYEF